MDIKTLFTILGYFINYLHSRRNTCSFALNVSSSKTVCFGLFGQCSHSGHMWNAVHRQAQLMQSFYVNLSLNNITFPYINKPTGPMTNIKLNTDLKQRKWLQLFLKDYLRLVRGLAQLLCIQIRVEFYVDLSLKNITCLYVNKPTGHNKYKIKYLSKIEELIP